MLKIKDETIIQRIPDQEFTYIDNEIVMLSLKNAEYYGMDKVGSRIWALLEKPQKFHSLIDQLLEEFEIDRLICESDTLEYLNALKEKNLIIIGNENH